MKFYRELQSTGRLSIRKNEERGKPERAQMKDQSLQQPGICLSCNKPDCRCGTCKQYREAVKNGKK